MGTLSTTVTSTWLMINGRDEEMTTDFLTHLFKDTSTKKLTYPLKIDGWMNKFGGTC